MADLDPKEILLNNKALVGAYALALAPVILYFPLVESGVKGSRRDRSSFVGKAAQLRSQASQANSLASRIENPDPNDPVYTRAHVDQLGEQEKLYQQELGRLAELVRERDQALEKWFDDPKFAKLKPGEDPPASFATEFRTYWTNVAIPKLIEDYREIVVPPGGDVDRANVYDREPGANDLRRTQKLYWIQQAILEAIKAATDDRPAHLLSEPMFADGKDGEQELYKSLDVRLELSCSFRQVPRIVRELLAREISMRVENLGVEKAPFRIEDYDIGLTVDGGGSSFTEDVYTGRLPTHDAFKGEEKLEEYIPEPNVKLSLKLKVYDFEPPAPPPPPEEGDGDAMMDE